MGIPRELTAIEVKFSKIEIRQRNRGHYTVEIRGKIIYSSNLDGEASFNMGDKISESSETLSLSDKAIYDAFINIIEQKLKVKAGLN